MHCMQWLYCRLHRESLTPQTTPIFTLCIAFCISDSTSQLISRSLKMVVQHSVKLWSLAGKLSLPCTRSAADGWPLLWVNRLLQVNQPGQHSLSSFGVEKWAVSWNLMCYCVRVPPSGESYKGNCRPGKKVRPAYHQINGLVTCRLTAYTPGSAPGPTFGN